MQQGDGKTNPALKMAVNSVLNEEGKELFWKDFTSFKYCLRNIKALEEKQEQTRLHQLTDLRNGVLGSMHKYLRVGDMMIHYYPALLWGGVRLLLVLAGQYFNRTVGPLEDNSDSLKLFEGYATKLYLNTEDVQKAPIRVSGSIIVVPQNNKTVLFSHKTQHAYVEEQEPPSDIDPQGFLANEPNSLKEAHRLQPNGGGTDWNAAFSKGSPLRGSYINHTLLLLLSHILLFSTNFGRIHALQPTGTIQDVEHVVLFMQENRAFDHYFGIMAGVRGFGDPNVHIASNGKSVWNQKVDSTLSNATDTLFPFYINAAGGNITRASQCMGAGDNGWIASHNALADGDNNEWALNNSPYSLGYYKRADVPVHFAIAEGWTVADLYTQSVIASTLPNRAYWASGSINVPGGPQSLDQGGVVVDNNETPGCKDPNISCYPYKWKTVAEYLEEANITWQVYQDLDNFDDDPFKWFENFQTAPENSSLAQRGLAFLGLDAFYDAAAKGTLPEVSYIVGAQFLSEHPSAGPNDGAWLQQQVVNAVIHSPKYHSTILMISYDETGGWADHVVPITSPFNTSGEWLPTDPFNPGAGPIVAGPGFRLPFYAISPFSRGGHLFTAHSDHSSQIMFLEKWLTARGKTVLTTQLNEWRRQHMSDLTDMFDFSHPDYSLPHMPVAKPPLMNDKGEYIGTQACLEEFPDPYPVIPYGKQTLTEALFVEDGFKSVRGALSEGHYLVFEAKDRALSYDSFSRRLGTSEALHAHNGPGQRLVLHATTPPPGTNFKIQFAGSPSHGFVGDNGQETNSIDSAAVFEISYLGNGKGYTVQQLSKGKFLSLDESDDASFSDHSTAYQVFSVTMSHDAGAVL